MERSLLLLLSVQKDDPHGNRQLMAKLSRICRDWLFLGVLSSPLFRRGGLGVDDEQWPIAALEQHAALTPFEENVCADRAAVTSALDERHG